MPIVATITAITFLLSRGKKGQPFSDPVVLRDLLNDSLAGETDETLQKALMLVDELESLQNRYRARVESSIDAYIEESLNRYTAATELIKRLEPLDRERSQTLQKMIELRQSMFELLSDEQWEAVFK